MMVSSHAMWIGLLALGLGPAPSLSCVSPGSVEQDSEGAQAAAAPSGSFELASGIVVDFVKKRVYVMTPDQKVRCLDLGGEVVWEYGGSARPLAIDGDLLLCQSESPESPNRLSLVVLNTRRAGGDPVFTSAVSLPESVNARIDAGLDGTFTTRAAVRGEAFVAWEFHSHPIRGMPTAGGLPGQTPANVVDKKGASGTVRLDMRTGQAAAIASEDIPMIVREAMPMVRLAVSPQAAASQELLSIDGRHALRSERVADDSVFEKHQWTIVDQATGEAVGQVRSHVARARFVVINSLLLYQTGPFVINTEAGPQATQLELRAIDLRTGKLAWSRPVRDTVYRGVLPG